MNSCIVLYIDSIRYLESSRERSSLLVHWQPLQPGMVHRVCKARAPFSIPKCMHPFFPSACSTSSSKQWDQEHKGLFPGHITRFIQKGCSGNRIHTQEILPTTPSQCCQARLVVGGKKPSTRKHGNDSNSMSNHSNQISSAPLPSTSPVAAVSFKNPQFIGFYDCCKKGCTHTHKHTHIHPGENS